MDIALYNVTNLDLELERDDVCARLPAPDYSAASDIPFDLGIRMHYSFFPFV
jgi:hypothetical protein